MTLWKNKTATELTQLAESWKKFLLKIDKKKKIRKNSEK